MLPIAVDAMGGDRAPGEILAGAHRAVDELGIDVVLVGPGRPRLRRPAPHPRVRGHRHGRGPGRRRPPQEGRVARAGGGGGARREGRGHGVGRQHRRGRWRPRSCGWAASRGSAGPPSPPSLPVPNSSRATVLLDAGANAECQPEWLVQFAQMGSVFARHRFGLDEPRVGLLSIGEEHTQGQLAGEGDARRCSRPRPASASSATSRAGTSSPTTSTSSSPTASAATSCSRPSRAR